MVGEKVAPKRKRTVMEWSDSRIPILNGKCTHSVGNIIPRLEQPKPVSNFLEPWTLNGSLNRIIRKFDLPKMV